MKTSKSCSFEPQQGVGKSLGADFLFIVCLGIAVAFASSCFAEGLSASRNEIPRITHEFQTSNLKINLQTKDAIDVSSLLKNIDDNDSIESAQAKVDEARMKLYPKKEIVMEVEKVDPGVQICSYVNLYKSISWWNVENQYNYYWSAVYYSTPAVLFLRVKKGQYDLYRYINGSWAFLKRAKSGSTTGATIYGSPARLGFKGIGKTDYNKADIIMYFYN